MKFANLDRTHSTDSASSGPRKHVPWTASPLDKRALQAAADQGMEVEMKSPNDNEHPTLQFSEPAAINRDTTEEPKFKPHHESSTIELFYDLFFVANLSTFTHNHEVTSGKTLTSYLGFFTLMWFTWLQTSLFDVRFSTDSVFNRIGKAISFGVMTGFAVVSSQYNTDAIGSGYLFFEDADTAPAFRAMALILMASRLVLVAQYCIVLWYVRAYDKCKGALAATIGVLLVTSAIYLGTYWGFPSGTLDDNGNAVPTTNHKTYIGWYVVVVLESFAVICISCFRRVVSFKHTHLVERIGLLTLIIMGEGIIGMTSSVSTILQNTVSVTSSDIGQIIAAVLLIYFVWILYFDQIENDRFGTIRQQIWALLHYPLHVAILLTVEGSTQLILWNEIRQNFNWLSVNLWPAGDTSFNTTTGYVASLSQNLTDFDDQFKTKEITEYYNYTVNLTSLSHLDVTTTKGNDEANNIYVELYEGLSEFIFTNLNIEVPDTDATTSQGITDAYFNVYDTVYLYFYISAGVLLITLAILYWFGKTHKSGWELLSIFNRIAAGIAVACIAAAGNFATGGNLMDSPWPIAVVVIVYFVVIVIDNFLVWHTNRTIAHALQYQRTRSQGDLGDTVQEAQQHSQQHSSGSDSA